MMRRMALAGALLLATSCAEKPEPAVTSLSAATDSMPALMLVHDGAAINDSIDDRIMKVAVNSRGQIAIVPSMLSNPVIRFVDSTGHFSGGAGPAGPGPGELGFPPRMWWIDSSLVAYETDRLVRIQYDASGHLSREHPTEVGMVPLAAGRDGVVEFPINWRDRRRPPALMLRPLDSGRSQVLLDDRHPQLLRAVNQGNGVAITYPWPVVAMQKGVLALIEPRTPTIWYFNLSGVLLDSVVLESARRLRGPREAAEELDAFVRVSREGTRGPDGKRYAGPDLDSVRKAFENDRPPVAFIHGANFDGHGRLWIIGPHNDSTRALVFSGTRLLGKVMVACYRGGRFVSVSDRWVALLCSKGNEADPPFEVQLYRIVEPEPNALP